MPDYSIKTTDEEDNYLNTECKTIDGLNKQEIQKAGRRVSFVWQKLKEFCKDTPESFVVIPAGAFEGITTPSFEIRMPNAARHQIDEQVYPQITYCLPLIKIRSVFYRINTLASFKKSIYWNFLIRLHMHFLKSMQENLSKSSKMNAKDYM